MKQNLGPLNLLFPNPVLVVGTYDVHGEPNAATLAWGGIASSGPESVSIAVRPSRYTHEALERTRAFTLNLPSVEYAAQADYFGMVSGRDVRKFEATGLTPVRGEFVDAPYIAEFPFCMECEVTHTLSLEAHTLFIGRVLDAKLDESLLGGGSGDDGGDGGDGGDGYGNRDGHDGRGGQDGGSTPRWERARILTFDSGLRAYRAPGELVGQAFSIGRKFIAK